ncbi:uncharacterized protein LOC134706940 [Mytilus trossulus]|uniref:uncharacterized protein LOC134706940 n=1 Tax=Mytilus trossulus TaxID=6551 RepID=UPI003007A3F6
MTEDSKTISIRTLLLFHKDENSLPFLKEKTNIVLDSESFTELNKFKKYVVNYCGINESACEKGMGRNVYTKLGRQYKDDKGKVENFSINTQQQWDHENTFLQSERSTLIVSVTPQIVVFKKKTPIIQIIVNNDETTTSEQRCRKRKTEVQDNKSLLKKIKMGETITERTDKQTSELEDFRQLIKECGNSVAVNEITVECGICQKKYKVEADRSIASKVSYFRRKHFDACTGKSNCKSICEKENNQMKSAIASWLTRPSKQDETTANAMSDDSDIDTDLIVTPSDG